MSVFYIIAKYSNVNRIFAEMFDFAYVEYFHDLTLLSLLR